MSFSEAFTVSHLVEAVLKGKQPVAPVLADLKAALTSMLKAVEKVEEHIRDAVGKGARVVSGGHRHAIEWNVIHSNRG